MLGHENFGMPKDRKQENETRRSDHDCLRLLAGAPKLCAARAGSPAGRIAADPATFKNWRRLNEQRTKICRDILSRHSGSEYHFCLCSWNRATFHPPRCLQNKQGSVPNSDAPAALLGAAARSHKSPESTFPAPWHSNRPTAGEKGRMCTTGALCLDKNGKALGIWEHSRREHLEKIPPERQVFCGRSSGIELRMRRGRAGAWICGPKGHLGRDAE